MADKDVNKTPNMQDPAENSLAVKRSGKQTAKLQQRVKVTKWILLSLLLLVIILYLLFLFFWRGGDSGSGDDYGDFTVKIDKGQRNLISLCEKSDFAEPTIFLRGTSVQDLWHSTRSWIPDNIHTEVDGGAHNRTSVGKSPQTVADPSYLAYTFHLKNVSDEELKYTYDMILVDRIINKEIDALDAMRVMIIRNGEKVVWAKSPLDGTPLEPDTSVFTGEPVLMEVYDNVIQPGDTDRYTVVMWLEGEDPECVNSIFSNMLKFEMNFEVQNKLKETTSETSEK
ncbi:MAG: hypothetical protein IJA55_01010 [Clostridia bacterium]|nr:hypothetical protein [Clostridia bacterium]